MLPLGLQSVSRSPEAQGWLSLLLVAWIHACCVLSELLTGQYCHWAKYAQFSPRGALQPQALRRRQDSAGSIQGSQRSGDISKGPHISVADCGLDYSVFRTLIYQLQNKATQRTEMVMLHFQEGMLPCTSCLSWSEGFSFRQTGDELTVGARFPDITVEQSAPVITHGDNMGKTRRKIHLRSTEKSEKIH